MCVMFSMFLFVSLRYTNNHFKDMAKINCIGILTSGGDAPGMNAAIRAITRAGIAAGLKVKAI